MSSSIADAISQARAEAAQVSQAQTGSAVAQPAQQGGGMVTAGAPRSLQDFMATAAMDVAAYIGVSELGMRFGKDKLLHDEIIVDMLLSDAKAGFTYRFNTPGQGTSYLTSWDGAQEAKTKMNWAAACAQAKTVDGGSYGSDLIELPVKLVGDYKRKEGGVLEDGTVVGLSISYMNSKAFSTFLKKVAPIFGFDTSFRVKLTAIPRTGGGGAEYGVFGYEVLGKTDDLTAEAAAPKAGGKKAA